MSEKKDMIKLQPNAKEFVPKLRKSSDIATREGRSGSVSLNPAAREFIPKLASPIITPVVAPLVPEQMTIEGSFLLDMH